MKNTLFEAIDKQDVHDSVARYLLRESKKSGAPVRRTDTRGWYKLNPKSAKVQQLAFEYDNSDNPFL